MVELSSVQRYIYVAFPYRYMIPQYTDIERFFSINSEEGLITTMKPLDRETQAWHNISVSATEIGMHKRQTPPTVNGNWDWIWRALALKPSKQPLWLIVDLLPRSDLLRTREKWENSHQTVTLNLFSATSYKRVKLQSVSDWSCRVVLKMYKRENVKMREQMENFQPGGLSAVMDAQSNSYFSANSVHSCLVH